VWKESKSNTAFQPFLIQELYHITDLPVYATERDLSQREEREGGGGGA